MKLGKKDLTKSIFIVAEIGNNHEGDLQTALNLVDAASQTGVDAVKFQTFNPKKYYAISEIERIKKLEEFKLSYDDFVKIKDFAEERNLIFFSTPFDIDSAKFLREIQSIFKISSGDNTFWRLIKEVNSYNLPTIISTGASNLKQIDKIYDYWKRSEELSKLCLLHCVSSYPVPVEEANLRMIKQLISRYKDITVGYSDHTLGIEAAVSSASIGARLIEKHFTLDKNYSSFRDHLLSADPKEMKLLVERVRQIELLYGTQDCEVQPCEENIIGHIKRSLAANKNLNKGTVIKPEMIMCVRPGKGIPEEDEYKIIGTTLKKNMIAGELFTIQ
tara:strand:- start:651 stop:1643 length:993 start_codon:yes stop_codon:yes gene_type:complete